MKMLSALIFIGLTWFYSFFLIQPDKNHLEETKTSAPSIDGAWELYSTTTGTITTFHQQSSQLMIYSKGYHAMISYDESGKFSFATAGPYCLNGNQYQVTFSHHSYEPWQGVSMWWDWSISDNGDTLYFSGPTKIIQADGKDIIDQWGEKIFEKKVRVRP